MQKITLNYDAQSGNISLNDGTIIFTWLGISGHDAQDSFLSVDDVISLKKADFTVDEIAELKRQKIVSRGRE